MNKVSIIIPVYNMENYVSEGIGCIRNQSYENLEIIIIDDGSKDKTYLRCLAEADRDKRITVFSKNNEGPAAARNYALGKATGEYVYFFDMDDYLEPDAIEKLVEIIEREDVDLAVCSFSMYNGKRITKVVTKKDGLKRTGDEARADYAPQLSMYGRTGIQGAAWYKLYKLSIIKNHNILFPNLRKSEDDVFVARYMNYANGFYITGDILCRYSVNSYKRFWDKYKFDIFETARKSTMYMLDIVGNWNKENKDARNRILEEYFQKTFGSFCFLFNPNLKLSRRERLTRIKEIADIFRADMPEDGFKVNHKIYECIMKKQYKKIYLRIHLHVIKHKND